MHGCGLGNDPKNEVKTMNRLVKEVSRLALFGVAVGIVFVSTAAQSAQSKCPKPNKPYEDNQGLLWRSYSTTKATVCSHTNNKPCCWYHGTAYTKCCKYDLKPSCVNLDTKVKTPCASPSKTNKLQK